MKFTDSSLIHEETRAPVEPALPGRGARPLEGERRRRMGV
ncbi:hypothetical protein SRS16CHR_03181 [Variovorax sp. SRS16]|nr:hypothetical protein SRS16CHR_03181 [Variovorax sp. SRS16]